MDRRRLFVWSGAVWTTAASVGIICALVVGAQARDKGNATSNGQTLAPVRVTQPAINGAPVSPAHRAAAGAGCPLSSCTDPDVNGLDDQDPCTLTQSMDTTLDGTNTIACGVAGPPNETTPNGWGRCFDLQGDLGLTALLAFEVDSVTFAIQQATVADILLEVILYRDTDNAAGTCNPNPTNPLVPSLFQLCKTSVMVSPTHVSDTPVPCTMDAECIAASDDDTSVCGAVTPGFCDLADTRLIEPITVTFPNNPVVPPGRDLFVEIRNPEDGTAAGNDFALRIVSNAGGECADTWMKSPDGSCAIVDWTRVYDECLIGCTHEACVNSLCAMSATACTTDADCPGTCDLNAAACTTDADCPPAGQCAVTGAVCMNDAACPNIGNFPNSDLFLIVNGVVRPSAAQASCNNGVLQGCEECDPPTPGQPVGSTYCNLLCNFPDCGEAVAGDCCDPAGHLNPSCGACGPNPAASPAECCQAVCEQDAFCCDTTDGPDPDTLPDGSWDSTCAAEASDICGGAGECCKEIKLIATCNPADVTNIEGCLSVGSDEWGATFDAATFGGLGGDTYNPIDGANLVGTTPAAAVTFSGLLFFFHGNNHREALSDITDDQHGLTDDDSCTTEATLTPLVTTDTNNDMVPDTSMGAFDVTCDTTVNLSFQIESHVETLNGFGAVGALLTQEYTITNNLAAPIEFTLVRHTDYDLLWDPDAQGATDDSAGTMSNGSACGKFVTEKETDVANTAVTLSSPQATRYYASKGYSNATVRVLNPNNLVIDGPQEPTTSTGTGMGTATLAGTAAAPTFAWSVTYAGLTSNATAAHFHGASGCLAAPCGAGACVDGQTCVAGACVACDGTPGHTAPAIAPPGNLLPPMMPAGAFAGGPIPISTTQADEVEDGGWYVNIHSTMFTGGEIRGQLGPTWGFGTDLQQWSQRAVAIPWRNRVPVVGVNTNGFSGDLAGDANCDPCDASVGLEIPVCLDGMGTATVFVYTTYGSEIPGGAACQPPDPICQSCPACFGEANGDNLIDANDLAQLLGDWGPAPFNDACHDFNGDGLIDASDLAPLLGNWGPC